MQYASYHDILKEELEKRRQINGSYSLRAFARDIGLPASRLSQVLNNKQGLSIECAESIAQILRLDEKKKKWFCHSVGSLHARSFRERNKFKEKALQYKGASKVFNELQLEFFKVISDWYHYAILELTYLEDFQSDVSWIAEVLSITENETQDAIERMKELGLLEEVDGTLKDKFKFLETPSDIPSMSLKKFHTQLMKKATEALYEQSVGNREMASNVFAIDKSRLPEFKEKMRDFRHQLDFESSQHKTKNSVYCLSMQFYEITNRSKK